MGDGRDEHVARLSFVWRRHLHPGALNVDMDRTWDERELAMLSRPNNKHSASQSRASSTRQKMEGTEMPPAIVEA